jgi:regulator of PEP synthase PpsR (kinase-PPPase family)
MLAVITCVTEITKLAVFTRDLFATMVTMLTMFLGQQVNHGSEGNHEYNQIYFSKLVYTVTVHD